MNSLFKVLAATLSLVIINQNCSKYKPVDTLANLSSLEKSCVLAPNPEYRTSLLTKVEIGYVLRDLFPGELAQNLEISKKAGEISEINVDATSDQTIYAENNAGNLETEVYLMQLLDLAQLLFNQYLIGPNFKTTCDALSGGCLGYYVNSVVVPLWRRPLTNEEMTIFDELFKKGITLKEKVNLLFITALTSPQFYLKNYLPKGSDERNLTYSQYFLASRLSFFLYNSVPDQELLQDAASGRLQEDIVLQGHVDRLLSKELYLQRFVRHTLARWLQIEKDLESVEVLKNDKLLTVALKETALQQLLMLTDIVKNDESIANIMYGTDVYMNKSIATYLGIDSTPYGTNLQRVPASLAKGLSASYLTSPHFANRAKVPSADFKTLVTARGKAVAKNFLCEAIPVNELDPEAVSKVLGPSGPMLNEIQLSNIRRSHVACMGCHRPIDTAGMGLEFVDYFGRLRSSYANGTKIEINFELEKSEIREVKDLSTFLNAVSKDDRFHSCFVKTVASRVAPIRLEADSPCAASVYELNRNQGIRSYVKGLVTSKIFKMAEVKL